ncbi:alpha-1,4-N-acetylglucosaminyltransferase-like [Engystomops pustulosus]|uniref:alpha-1,4-N-acetylglucosaminyltransferase-like n=1 Tax=Engystomops pustulosus TaxID=76066 RepID=UPI003AFB7CDB
MFKRKHILATVLLLVLAIIFTRRAFKQNGTYIDNFLISADIFSIRDNEYPHIPHDMSTNALLQQGNGIFFLETTDRIDEPSLVLCGLESAARVYPDRPVVFFMKGLKDIVTEDDQREARKHFSTLSSFNNIYIFPLRLETIFADTPFLAWYEKIDPTQEKHWTHVKADACRLAIIWKYGGIYMDTDFISMRPIPEDTFLAGQHLNGTSNGIFGFPPQHKLVWELMESFVQNYKGEVWGHNGPVVFIRIRNKYCGVPQFKSLDPIDCANVSYLHPERFYPIFYPSWRKYYEVWEKLPTFSDSYGLHLWNYMNTERKFMLVGSNTLVEHLYQKYCPVTYESIVRNVTRQK